jgi:hypothetical protein
MSWFAASAWAATAGLALAPFGAIEERLRGSEPWRGYDARDSYFTLVRAQRWPLAGGEDACRDWMEALRELRHGLPLEPAFRAWEPWEAHDTDSVRACREAPCKVKLGRDEGAELGRVAAADRPRRYLEIVSRRAERYRLEGVRPPFEHGVVRTDPWRELEGAGFAFAAPSAPPPTPTIVSRVLDLRNEQVRRIRQVLDQRVDVRPPAEAGGAWEGHFWVRDVYSAHYFDVWGERLWLRCDPRAQQARSVHALLVDFDLLRKTDLVTRLARPRLRAGIRDMGARYLDEAHERLASLQRQRQARRIGEASGGSRPAAAVPVSDERPATAP